MAVAGASVPRDFTVGFLSLSSETSTEKFIAKIDDANRGQKCVFSKLTIADLQAFDPRRHDFDAVVLLHSISQGRNSITDVADAKYNKLLPQLKAKYGPHRVGVIVHSMMSFNPDTKYALMMVFKKSQPTTFKCSNCVIQCGKPAEMPEDDFARLVDFLGDAPKYKLPTCDESLKHTPTPLKKEILSKDGPQSCRDGPAASSGRPTSSASPKSSKTPQRKDGILEDASKSHQESPAVQNVQDTNSAWLKETSDKGGFSPSKELLSECPTRNSISGNWKDPSNAPPFPSSPVTSDVEVNPSKGEEIANRAQYCHGPRGENMNEHIGYPSQRSVPSTHSSNPPTGKVKYHDSADASRSDAYTGQCASSSVTLGTKSYSATSTQRDLQTSVKPALIVALIVVPDDRNHVAIKESVSRTLQEGNIFATKQMQELENNWHMIGAILIDVGPPENIRNLKGCLDDMVGRCRKKLRVPQNVAILMKKTDHFPDDRIKELEHLWKTRIFFYEDVSGNSTVFDDATTHSLIDWEQKCYSEYLRAHAKPRTGNVFIQSVFTGIKSVFD